MKILFSILGYINIAVAGGGFFNSLPTHHCYIFKHRDL
jgi:hypothetical protein